MNQDNQDRRNADEKVKEELAQAVLSASGSDDAGDAQENFSLNDDRRVKPTGSYRSFRADLHVPVLLCGRTDHPVCGGSELLSL